MLNTPLLNFARSSLNCAFRACCWETTLSKLWLVAGLLACWELGLMGDDMDFWCDLAGAGPGSVPNLGNSNWKLTSLMLLMAALPKGWARAVGTDDLGVGMEILVL